MPNAQTAKPPRGKGLITAFGCACLPAEGGRAAIIVSHDGEFMHLTCDCEIYLTKGGSPYERN